MKTESGQEATVCAGHPQARAVWSCLDCGSQWCNPCVKQVRLPQGKTVSLCPACQGLCERLSAIASKQHVGSFGEGLLSSVTYPFQGTALALLLGGGFVQLAMTGLGQLLQSRPGGGLAFISSGVLAISVLGVGIGAYILCFLRQVLLTSSDGETSPPGWPEFDAAELAEVALQFIAIGLVSFGPATLCRIWLQPESPGLGWVATGAYAAGAVYFPMAVLAVTIYDNVTALNPLLIAVSIVRTLPRYFVLCVGLGLLGGLGYAVDLALKGAGVTWIALGGLAELYGALVFMRALGLFYHLSKEKLGWS